MRQMVIGTAQPGKPTCVTQWGSGTRSVGEEEVDFVARSLRIARLAMCTGDHRTRREPVCRRPSSYRYHSVPV